MSNLLTKALNSIDIFYGRFIPQLLFSFIAPIILILFIATRDLLSAAVAIFTLPLIPFFGALIGRYTSDAVGKKWRVLGTLSSYFEDSLNGYATLKLFGRTDGQSKRIEEMGKRYSEETMKVLRISFLSSLALELAATISVAVIAVEIGLRLVAGSIEFSNALMILILAPEIYFPLRNAAALFHASTDGTEAL
ncbi:MAG: ABC transporter transmembrane domain-containing protein, partial [Actinomycetales bacterium]